MKKVFFVSVLALTLVFAMAVSAMAGTYQGFEVTGNVTPGFMPWNNPVGTTNAASAQVGTAGTVYASSPHGGYVSTTTKCVVCHSVHRAPASGSVGGTGNSVTLAAGSSCATCHAIGGGQVSVRLVEWNAAQSAHNGDTVAYPGTVTKGCTTCHTGGIHGKGSSTYYGAQAFMVGGGAIDTSIGNLMAVSGFNSTAANWINGTTKAAVNVDGSAPISVGSYAIAKTVITGAVCAQSGCHDSGTFAVTTLGGSQNDPNQTGHQNSTTGTHVNNVSCGPCHPGNASPVFRQAVTSAGGTSPYVYSTTSQPYFPIASAEATAATGVGVGRSRTYGCDQCHDAIGVATNTTAFPHGTKGIDVYQYDATAGLGKVTTAGQNLWMYSASIVGSNTAASGRSVASTQYDNNVKLVAGAIANGNAYGNAKDGACLKCHIAVDSASVNGGTAAYFTVSGTHTSNFYNSSATTNYAPKGGGRNFAAMYLFK